MDADAADAMMALNFLLQSAEVLGIFKKKLKRRWWVHPALRNRGVVGYSSSLIPILHDCDLSLYTNFLRLSPTMFEYLLQMIAPIISKSNTTFRKCIPVEICLQLTLRFLATGEKFNSICFQFRVGRTTAGLIIKDTCHALWNVLAPKYLKFPQNQCEWRAIADKFFTKWQLPNCVGAIDGKHVRIQKPKNTGFLNFNYKKYFSKVLFAVTDANYKFIYVDVGNYGSEGDSGILTKSSFGKALNESKLNLPQPNLLPNSNDYFHHYFVGDQAFPLRPDLLRPYKGDELTHNQKVFNYRICRARRVVENLFGILANRFRIFRTELSASEETNDFIVLATIALHNFLIAESCQTYCPNGFVDYENEGHHVVGGTWRDDNPETHLIPHQQIGSANFTRLASSSRDLLTKYFVSRNGCVAWQEESILHGNF